MKKYNKLKSHIMPSIGIVLGLTAFPAIAEETENAEPSKKPVPTLTAEEIKLHSGKALLPLPAEVLSVLKIKEAEGWQPVIDSSLERKPLPNNAGTTASAARLGIRGADAFLALQAKNKELLNTAIAEILPIAERLGVDEALVETGRELKSKVDSSDWPAVLGLLDSTYSGALEEIEDVGDPESVAIASAAGWLRGTQIFTLALLPDFKAETARALRQPQLVESLAESLQNLPEAKRKDPAVAGLLAALNEIHGIINVGTDASFTKEQVELIGMSAAKATANL